MHEILQKMKEWMLGSKKIRRARINLDEDGVTVFAAIVLGHMEGNMQVQKKISWMEIESAKIDVLTHFFQVACWELEQEFAKRKEKLFDNQQP